MRAFLLAVTLAMAAPAQADPVAAPPPSSDNLLGLWMAKQRLGPDIRGELVIVSDASGWRATLAGRTADVQRTGDLLTFSLGDDGDFRGHLTKKGITGHWRQVAGYLSGTRYATPVTLTGSKGVWRGDVQPLDDTGTLYLNVTKNADGTLNTFLRNPESNAGRFANIDHIKIDGDKVSLLGHPHGAKDDRVVGEGSYHRDEDGFTLHIPAFGSTFDFRRDGAHSGFYPRDAKTVPYVYHPPIATDDGWPVGTLRTAGLSEKAIGDFMQMLIDMPMDSIHAQDVHAVLIARHGKLVLEEYLHGFSASQRHDTRSASKSMLSVLVGAEIQAGAKVDVDAPVYKVMNDGAFPAGLEPRKQAMRLEDLLTMSSGFYCDDNDDKAPGNEDTMQDQRTQPDWYRYTLELPMAMAPGTQSIYCSANPNLAGGVLAKMTGEPLEEAFDRLIAKPLQFGPYALNLQPTGQPYMGGGAYIRPRDFMKLGQLMLDDGMWNGKRIVGHDWVAKSTAPLRDLRGLKYGYFWWGMDFPYKGGTVHGFFAAGNGGQVVMVVPKLDLVVAFFGGNYGDKALYVPQQVYTPKYVLPAIE